MKTLIIAEKPDMGRTIAAVIEPKATNKRTYLEGERFIITWAIGHLVSLAEPDQYDARYKKWNAQDLPIIPDRFKLWPNPRTKDQLKTIGELAKRCGRLINACDAGREGQLIFHLIRQFLKLPQPTDRLWISDLTPETIRKGFSMLRSDNDYDPLTKAARARSEADWLIGMNASRAFTIKHKTLLSVGRVQTPVLALLYDRHKEITVFQSETYYVVRALFTQNDFSYTGIWQGKRITDKEKAQSLAAKVTGKPAVITDYQVTESKEYPYRLHDLTLLQREANGRYGYSAKKTLDIAQALYEKHKVISYPRTNSNYVTEENLPVMNKVLSMLQGTSYADLANGADRSRVHKGNKAVCNPSKVEDHHAIIPTPKKATGLSTDEQHIYDMIVRRFLSHYYPPAIYKNHIVLTEVEKEIFRSKAKEQLEAGWKVVLQDNGEGNSSKKSNKQKNSPDALDDEEELIDRPFTIKPNAAVRCESSEALEKETQPPKAFTEGTLLKAMESAGKSMEDDELREAMKDTGLGTPATRAATIERLKQVGYVTLSGKKLEITTKGVAAIELIRGAGVELLASPEMTGRWEQRLHQISKGEASDDQFIARVKQFASMVVEKVNAQQQADPNLFEQANQDKQRNVKSSSTRASSRRSSTPKSRVKASRKSTEQTSAYRSNNRLPVAKNATVTVKSSTKLGEAIGSCPRTGCSGSIIEGKRGYGCSAFRSGCTFVVWKEQEGKKITLTMIKALLTKGMTSQLTFQRHGQTLKGKLVLVDRNRGTLEMKET